MAPTSAGWSAVTPLGFNGSDNYGTFQYNTQNSAGLFTGVDFADFLLGLPYQTFYDVVEEDNDGKSTHYHFFGQDQWKVSSNLRSLMAYATSFIPAITTFTEISETFFPSRDQANRSIPWSLKPTGQGLPGQRQCLYSLWFDHGQHDQWSGLHAGALQQPGRLPQRLEKISSSTGSCHDSDLPTGRLTVTRL